MQRRRLLSTTAIVGATALLVAACGGSSTTGTTGSSGLTAPDIPMASEIGAGEGQINILAWPGYAEDGSTAKKVDWVTPFEQATGCKANVQIANTSDEMFEKMGTGQFDVVSASGDSSLRMIYAGKVAPVNTDLLTNYADIAPFQKDQAWNSVSGQMYGIPHGWGANLLQWRTDKVKPAPDSWSVVWEPDSMYKGKLEAYDSPTYIADAAVYLMATQPELGITDPYALDQTQFDAAIALLEQQKPNLGGYWSSYVDNQQNFESGEWVLGTSWQIITNLAQADGAPVKSVLPTEGSTGWADTWMVDAKSPNPNCAYEWLNWITNPDIQAEVAYWFGEAPANLAACDLIPDKTHCDVFHASDQAYFDQVWFWTTPQSECLDGRTDATCLPYPDWVQAWNTLKSG
jgi:putative spermidine/putrescine transport system substrate-binding protein